MLFGMCFAPAGGRVLTACRDGRASLGDWQSGHLVCSPGRHSFELRAVAFTRDGRWGLVGGRDPALGTRTTQAWTFITGKPVTPPLGAYVHTVSISLARPYKGQVRVSVDGILEALDGVTGSSAFSEVVR
jgi:WD40 repeat protein